MVKVNELQFELILAWQITSGSRGRGPMIFMPQMLNLLFFFARFANILFETKF